MKRDSRRIITGESGFTLLEVLVALSILGIALALTMKLISADLRGVAASDDSMRAVLLAEEEIQKLLAGNEIPVGNRPETERNGWRVEIQVSDELPERTDGLGVSLRKVTATVRRLADRQAGLRERTFTLTTLQMQVKNPSP
jgi:type II secretion system protein I